MGELIGIARFRFHPGKVEEYKRASAEAMEIVRAKEPGTLEYSIFFNEDETEALVIERFASSEALLQHGANMAAISEIVLKDGHRRGRAPRRAQRRAPREPHEPPASAPPAVDDAAGRVVRRRTR